MNSKTVSMIVAVAVAVAIILYFYLAGSTKVSALTAVSKQCHPCLIANCPPPKTCPPCETPMQKNPELRENYGDILKQPTLTCSSSSYQAVNFIGTCVAKNPTTIFDLGASYFDPNPTLTCPSGFTQLGVAPLCYNNTITKSSDKFMTLTQSQFNAITSKLDDFYDEVQDMIGNIVDWISRTTVTENKTNIEDRIRQVRDFYKNNGDAQRISNLFNSANSTIKNTFRKIQSCFDDMPEAFSGTKTIKEVAQALSSLRSNSINPGSADPFATEGYGNIAVQISNDYLKPLTDYITIGFAVSIAAGVGWGVGRTWHISFDYYSIVHESVPKFCIYTSTDYLFSDVIGGQGSVLMYYSPIPYDGLTGWSVGGTVGAGPDPGVGGGCGLGIGVQFACTGYGSLGKMFTTGTAPLPIVSWFLSAYVGMSMPIGSFSIIASGAKNITHLVLSKSSNKSNYPLYDIELLENYHIPEPEGYYKTTSDISSTTANRIPFSTETDIIVYGSTGTGSWTLNKYELSQGSKMVIFYVLNKSSNYTIKVYVSENMSYIKYNSVKVVDLSTNSVFVSGNTFTNSILPGYTIDIKPHSASFYAQYKNCEYLESFSSASTISPATQSTGQAVWNNAKFSSFNSYYRFTFNASVTSPVKLRLVVVGGGGDGGYVESGWSAGGAGGGIIDVEITIRAPYTYYIKRGSNGNPSTFADYDDHYKIYRPLIQANGGGGGAGIAKSNSRQCYERPEGGGTKFSNIVSLLGADNLNYIYRAKGGNGGCGNSAAGFDSNSAYGQRASPYSASYPFGSGGAASNARNNQTIRGSAGYQNKGGCFPGSSEYNCCSVETSNCGVNRGSDARNTTTLLENWGCGGAATKNSPGGVGSYGYVNFTATREIATINNITPWF